jgi:enediyne polyketide synthase
MVMALEAMASAAFCLSKQQFPVAATEFRAHHPLSFAEGKRVVMRTLALVQQDGSIVTEIRSEVSGFSTPHFSARFATQSSPRRLVMGPWRAPKPRAIANAGMSGNTLLYDGLCFHGPRWRKVDHVMSAHAMACVAATSGENTSDWFSSLLSKQMRLGDPATRDALLHVLQTCVPHQVVLPTSVEWVQLAVLDSRLSYEIRAKQRSQSKDEYIFDAELCDEAGNAVETWSGVRFQRTSTLVAPEPFNLPRELLPSLLERLCADALDCKTVTCGLAPIGRVPGASEAALKAATAVVFNREQEGRYTATGVHASTSHADDLSLALTSSTTEIGFDIQSDPPYESDSWDTILGFERAVFARQVQTMAQLPLQTARGMTWCVSEALIKLSVEAWTLAGASIERVPATRVPHLVRIRHEGLNILAGSVRVIGHPRDLWFAIALRPPQARPRDASAPRHYVPEPE